MIANSRTAPSLVFVATRVSMLVILASVLLSCNRPPPAWNPPERPFDFRETTTIGPETRISSGPWRKTILTGEYDSKESLPSTLPASELAAEDRVILHYEVLARQGSGRGQLVKLGEKAEVVAIENAKTTPYVRLHGLPDLVTHTPANVTITALLASDSAAHDYTATVTLPARAFLRVGYGLAPQSWVGRAAAVRFTVSVAASSRQREDVFSRVLNPAKKDHHRWFDEQIDLSEFENQQVVLTLRTAPASEGDFALPVWSDPLLYSPNQSHGRPNLILISLDTLRARSLGCYGYGRDTSPFLDLVASEGTLFETPITTSATTGPSHMSLFTGVYPPRHRILVGLERKAAEPPSITQVLRQAGYRTAAFTENGFLIRDRGFGDGFSQYTENRGPNLMTVPGEAKLTFSQAREWLRRNDLFPFFLFVHTYQVHAPYDPDAPYAELFLDDGFPGPEDSAVRLQRDNYDREIRIVDDVLRGFFSEVEHLGLSNSTIVVILSDHGEEFAEHGLTQHGAAVFDEVLHVPLIFWGRSHIPAGQRISGQVSLIDLVPTLLDFADLPTPPSLDGITLHPYIVQNNPVPNRVLFAEARGSIRWKPDGTGEPWDPPLLAWRRPDLKYIIHRPVHGTGLPTVGYDLASDPSELTPFPVSREQLRQVNAALDAYFAGRVVATAERRNEQLSPDTAERLRMLGYLE